jgi:hypothetical protein
LNMPSVPGVALDMADFLTPGEQALVYVSRDSKVILVIKRTTKQRPRA